MYKYFSLLVIAALSLAGCKNNNIEVKGKLENIKQGQYIYIERLEGNNLIRTDSVIPREGGEFMFSLRINNPGLYLLLTNQTSFLTMLLEPGQQVEIHAFSDSLNYPSYISGSPGTALMAEYNRKLQQTIKKLSGLREVYLRYVDKPGLPQVMDSLDGIAQNYLRDINSYTKKYIDDNLTSLVSLVALYQQVAPREYVLPMEKDLKYYIKVDSSLSLHYPDYEPVKLLHREVQDMTSAMEAQGLSPALPGIGKEAPEIILPNPEGDTIRLSSTRGKVVLLDFWASWCNPCRQENPNLVKAWSMFHNQGFEIFQVSLDKTKEAWLKGIQEDHLEKWIHVSDTRYWNSAVVPLYRIESIPSSFLLDKNGRIIASNLRGEQLLSKLAEIFNNQ